MVTKLQAADLARRSGATVVIARGSEPSVLTRLAAGEKLGTWFQPVATSVESRKRYILAGGRARPPIKRTLRFSPWPIG
jgi:glutamate 5-kinase